MCKKKNSKIKNMTAALLAVVFALLAPAAVFSATRTVCAACGYTSIANAYAVAVAGDTIDIQENRNESMTWAKAVNVTSTLQNITWNGAIGSTAATLTTNGIIGSTAWTISNITMDHSNATGGYTIYLYNNPAPNLTILNCTLMRSSTSATNNAVINADGAWSANAVTLSKCMVIGNNFEYGLAMSGGNPPGGIAYALVNTILYGFGGAGLAAVVDAASNVRQSVQMTNCTIYDNTYGYRYTGASVNAGATVRNTVFANNTTDAACQVKNDYTYCAFDQGAGFGTGCQYGVVDTTEFVNAPADFHLDSTSVKCRNLGTNTGAPADDIEGTTRPQELIVDIGAYEYVVPPTATNTPSVTQTSSKTSTATFSMTPTSSASATASMSQTPSNTGTWTASVSSSNTNTNTPTSSVSPASTYTQTPTMTGTDNSTTTNTPTFTSTVTITNTYTPEVYAYIEPVQAVSGQQASFAYHVIAKGEGPVTNVRIKIPAGAAVAGSPASAIPGASVSTSVNEIIVDYPAGWNIWSGPNFDTITFDCVSSAGNQYFGSYLNGIADAMGQTPNGYSQYVMFVTPTSTLTQTRSITPTITATATQTSTLPGTKTITPTVTKTLPSTPSFTPSVTVTYTPGAIGITAVFTDLAPVEASNGENNIKFFGLDLTNIGLVAVSVSALTITATDGAGGAINAAAYFNNMTAVDGAGNTYIAVFGSGNKIFFNPSSPIAVAGLGTIGLQFYADIKSSVLPGTVKLGVQAAGDIGATVSVSGSFPAMTAGTALKTTPADVELSFYDLMPPAVSVGQADVYAMVFMLENPGTTDNSPVSINALTLTVMDELSNTISAASAISRLVIRDSDTVYLDTASIPAGEALYYTLTQAITDPASNTRNFYCVVDITGNTTNRAEYLKIRLAGAAGINVTDKYSGAPVAVVAKSGYVFPMDSGVALIQNSARELHITHADKMPVNVSSGQDNVETMTLNLIDVGDTLTASIMVSRFYFHVQDASGFDILHASDVLKSLDVTDAAGISVLGSAVNLSLSKVMVNLTAPVIVPAGAPVTLSIRVGIASTYNPDAFKISLESADEIYAVDSNIFSKVSISDINAFPKKSGVAHIQDKVTSVTLDTFTSLIPLGVLKGQTGVQLFSYRVSDTVPATSADALIYGITIRAKSNGAGQAASNIFKNIFVVDASGNTVGSLLPVINDKMEVVFNVPVVLDPNSQKVFTVYADILPNTSYDNISVDVVSAADVSVKDANSMLEINKIFTPGLPWETYPEANIATAPATDLKAWHDGSIIPTLVGMGQPDVKFMSISFYNDGFVGMADIQINGITLTAMDDTSAAIPVHSALEKVYVKNQAGDITYDIADVSTDLLATSFYMNIGTPLLVPAAVTRTVYISADIPLDAVQRRMKLRFAVQGDCDRNSVPSGYVTFTASNSDTFPMDSGVTTITAIAYNFKVGHKDLMPVSAAAGQPGVRAMEIDFSSDNIIPIRVTAVALVVKDAGNSVIPASGVISRFIILDETGTTIGAGATGATGYVCVTLTPVQVSAGTIRNITGLLDIANNAGGSFYIELEKSTSVNTLPLSSVNPMNGDAFGSMRTKAVSIKGTGLESTFHFFPNPFCPVKEQCHIEYYLPQQREVTIKIYTMDGRLVRVPADKLAKDSGLHYEDVWDGRNGAGEKVSSGVYLCILKAIDKATGKETKLIEKIMAVR